MPSASVATTTTRMPAITALAALVPCADAGIRQMSRAVVAVAPVERPDREEPGELALRAGVRLERDGVVAGDRAEPVLQVGDELRVARGLVGRRVRDGCRRTRAR